MCCYFTSGAWISSEMEDWVIGLREIDDGAWGGSVEQIGDEEAGRRAREKKKLTDELRDEGGQRARETGELRDEGDERPVS